LWEIEKAQSLISKSIEEANRKSQLDEFTTKQMVKETQHIVRNITKTKTQVRAF
jgi:hypothetical protein